MDIHTLHFDWPEAIFKFQREIASQQAPHAKVEAWCSPALLALGTGAREAVILKIHSMDIRLFGLPEEAGFE